jgi:hypothetical protein
VPQFAWRPIGSPDNGPERAQHVVPVKLGACLT